MTDQLPALIIVIPLLGAFLTPLIGWHYKNLCHTWAVAVLIIPFYGATGILWQVVTTGPFSYRLGNWAPPWGIEYALDHLNALMLVIISAIGLLAAINAKQGVSNRLAGKEPQFYTLLLLQIVGLMGIVITGDLFNLFVFLEISSLSGYGLIAHGEDGAPLATFNYIMIGTVGACFYLLGVGYLYIATGSLNIADLAAMLPALYHSKVILVAFAFFTVGVAIKMGLFPLHIWMPDAYTTAPNPVSTLIAPLMTKVAAYILIRIMFTLFQPDFAITVIPVATILGWMSVIAILAGGLKALAQTDIKRMVTYIMVAEVGYIVMGVSVMNRMGLTGAILHILNDACMVFSLFLIIGAIAHRGHGRNIYHLNNLHKKMPLTMAAFTITALSMCGIPPACGFFSKWYLILGTIKAHQWIFAATLLTSSLINAVLFFRIIEQAYLLPISNSEHGLGQSHEEVITANEAPPSMLIPIIIMAATIILLGPLSGKIITAVIQHAVPVIF
ncbi:MAG: monovalent cation/H+ antiporter subunit D family protein [Deltaproteobacteria bacterium]|nr:monovalent cation/H+ antiporter subunit D family protein [Candidatus Anaeroferrophillus wilburensis]MBN2889101.1 monovalent cation/H+ antiporter subunit D family protein [Deltaproteobacteria bacterium]